MPGFNVFDAMELLKPRKQTTRCGNSAIRRKILVEITYIQAQSIDMVLPHCLDKENTDANVRNVNGSS